MLPGMTCLSGLVNSGLILFVDWYTTVGLGGSSETIQIINRPGFDKARITCIGPGGRGYSDVYDNGDGSYTYYGEGGYGGNCVTSIVTITSSDSLSAVFSDSYSYFQIGGTQIITAANSGIPGSSSVGQVIRYGSSGDYYETSGGGSALGGAAGGVYGNAVTQTPGAGFNWVRTSDRAVATNGANGFDYGGGSNTNNQSQRGRGLVAVEWGITKPF